jgi:aspartate/glutamate racemase
MPEIVAACMYSHKYTHPLIIGGYITTEKKIYSKYINNAYYLDSKGNRFFESVIEEIKLNSDIAENTESTMLDIIDRHKDKYDCIILACTEYSLISDKFKMSGVKVFDSNVIYANEAIRYAKNIV